MICAYCGNDYVDPPNVVSCHLCPEICRDDVFYNTDLILNNNQEDDMSVSEFIYKHDYKPVPVFHKDKYERNKNLYCGIELEIQGNDRDGFVDENKSNPFFYFKQDGSLDEDTGIEIVSHPATLKYHLQSWEKLFASLNEYDMNDLDNCGLHFHFNRNYFTNQDIASLDYFINNNQFLMEEIGGRSIDPIYCNIVFKRLSSWGKDVYHDRYLALNLQNKDTIEVRFFASTYDYDTFIKRLLTAFALVSFCKKYNTLTNNNIKMQFKFKKYLNKYLEKYGR